MNAMTKEKRTLVLDGAGESDIRKAFDGLLQTMKNSNMRVRHLFMHVTMRYGDGVSVLECRAVTDTGEEFGTEFDVEKADEPMVVGA